MECNRRGILCQTDCGRYPLDPNSFSNKKAFKSFDLRAFLFILQVADRLDAIGVIGLDGVWHLLPLQLMKMKIAQILLLALLGLASFKASKPNGAPTSTSTTSTSGAFQDTAKKVKDTASFVKNILAQKSRYLNKEFGVLLKELDLPVKSYIPIYATMDKGHVPGITIAFDDRKTTQWKMDHYDETKQLSVLYIIWATPVPAATYNELRQKSMAYGNWNAIEEEFYVKQIVKDIL